MRYVISHFSLPHAPRDNRHLLKVLALCRGKSPSNTSVWCLTLSLLTFHHFFFFLSFFLSFFSPFLSCSAAIVDIFVSLKTEQIGGGRNPISSMMCFHGDSECSGHGRFVHFVSLSSCCCIVSIFFEQSGSVTF